MGSDLRADSLATLEYRINGTGLQVTPAAVAVPKGIAGSVLVTLTGGDATQALAEGAYVEAFLRGPGFPEPRRIVSPVNQPMLFPPLNLVGDYQLDSVRLVDAVTGETRMEASPNIVPVRVFDEVLVSRVTSRPLTYEEIQEKGIFIDESNFRVVEFEAAFVLDGKTIPVSFPVVAPKFTESVELIPAAELEEKLAEAAALNQQIGATTQLPPEFEVAQLNIEIQGINFQVVDPSDDEPLGLNIPPIPALMVIPGNIGFLNQFFSVMIFTENAAPRDSNLSVYNIAATLKLPPGPDLVVSTNYAQPGDDPLRFARIGPDKIIQPVQRIVQPGPDGELGTPDDNPRLRPGQAGQAEFLVEGLQEGLHVMNLDLEATMDGLAAGPVQVKGKAAGSVLVRNPRFSMAFSHPRTVRVGEPYEASVTLLNTGVTPANLVQVTLNRNSISGARLEDETQQTVELGTLLPGQSATATFRLRSLRTGAISFSNLTTSDDSVVGRFRLSMGVDERGVALSPDTIALPEQVDALPAGLLAAANRVLGQALSVATAGQVPPGVLRVGRSTITRRVLDLAEAGQRLQYGDPARRVFADLLRDWQGGRSESAGFDQILRETDAGREWRDALFAVLEAADGLNGTERLVDRAADYAGLGQEFVLASANDGRLRVEFGDGKEGARPAGSTQPYALVYQGGNGSWGNFPFNTNATVFWTFTNGPPSADVAVLLVSTNGEARQLRWTIPNPPADAVYSYPLTEATLSPPGSPVNLRVDLAGDGVIDSAIAGTATLIDELPPGVLAVEQDLLVLAGRPSNPCIGPPYFNYGTVVAVVFSKPMTQASAGDPLAYTVDGDNGANSVQVQPGGRVAYLNLRKGVSAIIPRSLTITGVTDVRGNLLAPVTRPIRSVEPGTDVPFTGGVAIKGRALKGDGSPAPGIPVTLTMYDQVYVASSASCGAWVRRVSQVLTDAGGNFNFDFVLAGVPYSISATDTSGLSAEALTLIAGNTADGQVERERILQLATSAATRDTLLGMFAAGSLPEAIAKVEGLDRALVRDFVPVDSGREGQTVPMALRFRGRATVVGQVVAADGLTPLPRAAVNLFPDADSRELGRGILADGEGRFAFYGVPLGVYTVEVATSDRRRRTVAGLLSTPGEVAALIIELPDTVTPLGSLRGTVFEADNLTPHGGARIFIGEYGSGRVDNVVRIVDADADGNWRADDLPARAFDVVAVSFDGRRKGLRSRYTVQANTLSVANITLEATTQLFGRVQFEDGRPAPNALVAGGLTLVRTDEQGNFTLEGVPVGSRTISAGIERNPAAGIDFPRLGSATVNVIAGANNYVVVKLRAAGRIYGRVTDLNGRGIGGIRVAIPVTGGFFWTDADSQGNYVFENLGLGNYTLSAPSNATAPQLDVNKLNEQIRSGNEDEILAAFEEAIRVFIGADDPLITGAQLNFRPITWGFTETRLQFDGQSVEANIRMLREGTVAGRVLNHQGVPIGARVRLNGLGPDRNGEPKITIRGERDSDPATGLFIFPGQLLTGPWSVQAASPFYPVVLQVNGFTTEIDPNVTNVVLQFPPIRDTNGRLVGNVYNPDGSPVLGGVRVKIDFSDDYEIQTDEDGFFDTQILVPARGYRVEAIDDSTGLRGEAFVNVAAGITNQVNVHLLTRNSTVEVSVVRGNGLPAAGAQVDLDHGTYPRESRITAFADPDGRVRFTGLWEGRYSVHAQYVESATRVAARGGVTVAANQGGAVTLRLGGTGTITGRFVKLDQVTPVEGAQVSVGNLGFASTDAAGEFRFEGVPLGTHALVTSDPVSGAAARGSASITYPDQVVEVLLIEGARGEINGFVLDSYGQSYVAGAAVTVRYSDGLTPSRTVTTGPDGRFSIPGSPVGNFTLSAQDLPLAQGGRGTSGSAGGSLSAATLVATVNIQLQPLGSLPVNVVRADGVTPAENVTVFLTGNRQQDTDDQGAVRFDNLPFGNYTATAISRNGGELRNGARITTVLSQAGTNPPVTITLPGVGAVNGLVVASDGATPVSGAEVVITFQAPIFSGQRVTAVTGGDGRFAFNDVPVGDYRLTAASVSLAGSLTGGISAGGETDEVTLRLGDSGAITGRFVRADGVTPVDGIDVLVTYASQSANPGRAFVRSAADGTFTFVNIPVGGFELEAVAVAFGGLVKLSDSLAANGEVLALGDLRFDEDLPAVLSVVPANTADEVPTTVQVALEFSEELAASSLNTNGVFLRSVASGQKVGFSLALEETNGVPRRVRITPFAPLLSEQIYEVVVIAGELFNAGGGVVGSGPRDLVGRPLTTSFVSRFRTADNDPPVLLSIFPTNGMIQVDPRAVPRLSFNESLQPAGAGIRLTGPDGDVIGTTSVGVDGRVLSFVPADLLKANASYTLTVSNVFDLAGNRAAGEPFVVTFATLDTVGPSIATLRIGDGRAPVAGSTVPVEALLAAAEPGVSVRFTQDFNPLGSTTLLPYRVNATLPATGSTTIRAIATDQFGNDGQFAELVIAVQTNQPPAVQFARVTPLTGPAPSGSFVVVDVTATDDSGVAELRAIVAGIGSSGLITTNGGQLRVQGQVSVAAGSGSQVEIFAEAFDELGLSSGQRTFNLPISDGTVPTLAINSPAPNTPAIPGQNVPVTLQLNDNFGVSEVRLNISGAVIGEVTSELSPVITNGLTVVNFTVPADAPTAGGAVNLSITARDAAGNVSTAATLTLRLPDTTAPTLVSVSPANGATGVDPQAVIRLNFSEALDPATAIAENFTLLPVAGGQAIPLNLALEDANRRVVLTVTEQLALDAEYRLTVSAAVADAAGNPLGSEFSSTFRTGDFRLVRPTQGQSVVEGQALVLEASSPTATYPLVRFPADGEEVGRDASAPYQIDYTVPLIADLGATQLLIEAQAILPTYDQSLLTARAWPNERPVEQGGEPALAVDGDIGTFTWATALGNTVKPSYLGVLLDQARPVVGLRIYKDRNDGANFENSRDLVIQYTTDPVPDLATGTWQNVVNLTNGWPGGAEPMSASVNADGTVIGDWHHSGISGFATLRFDQVNATGVRIGFTSTSAQNYYHVAEFQLIKPLNEVTVLASASTTINLFGRDEDTDGDGFTNAEELARGWDPFTPNLPPVITVTNYVELVEGHPLDALIPFSVTDTEVPTRIWIRESLTDDLLLAYDRITVAGTLQADWNPVGVAAPWASDIYLRSSAVGQSQIYLRAQDPFGLTTTNVITVVTLPDLDLDMIPDRDDPDIDGDGLTNDQELALGTDPRKPDTDGDGRSDHAEVNGSGGPATNPLIADTDGDGLPDGFELALGLDPTNASDGSPVVVIDNRTVSFSGFAQFHTLILTNGAVLTHDQAGTGVGVNEPRGLQLVLTNLIVEAGSRIDVSAKGYLGGLSGANAGRSTGRTLGNRQDGGSWRRNGGSYGGMGGFGSAEAVVNPAYGDFRDPSELGSGGGSDNGTGGNGGGLVRVTAQSIQLDGEVLANGGNGVTWSGGGSGGGIKLVAASLGGGGRIEANGGRGSSNGGGGGGGRIALVYQSVSQTLLGNVRTYGGDGVNDGSAGTIYLRPGGQPDQLVIDGGRIDNLPLATPVLTLAGGSVTAVSEHSFVDRTTRHDRGAVTGQVLTFGDNSNQRFRVIGNLGSVMFTDPADGRLTEVVSVGAAYRVASAIGKLTVSGGATVALADAGLNRPDRRARLAAGDLELLDHAWLTHPVATVSSQFGLELNVTNLLTISVDSRIDVSGRGYLGGLSGGNNDPRGRTLGNILEGGSVRRNGGSHGGLGAFGNAEAFVNAVYGAYRDPNEPGSGGGSDNGAAGNGGGLVRIVAGTLQLEGNLLANGGNGVTWGGGGGGGGVKVTVGTLGGAGAIQARGGVGSSIGGGGGGGRIAVTYDAAPGFEFANVRADGGGGLNTAASGTVFIGRTGEPVRLVIRGTGVETPLPAFLGDEHVVLDNALVSATNVTVASLVLTNASVLRHPGATVTAESRLNITADTLVIAADSRINVSGRGYLGGLSGGNNDHRGRTLGDTPEGGSLRRNGGSYGGLGAFGNAEPFANAVYGDFRHPNEPGSGGGSDNGPGGNGGGLLHVEVQSLSLEGEILANGGDGSGWGGGGGGGGVQVNVGNLTGGGAIRARGGAGSSVGGGGGGGRVAVYYNQVDGFDFDRLEADGGTGLGGAAVGKGASGTIFLQAGSQTPRLVVRGNGRETPLPPTIAGELVLLDNTTVWATNLNVTTLTLTNGTVLTHPVAGLTNEHRLIITANTVTISTNSRIDVSARGYLGGRSGPNASNVGRTLGNTLEGGSLRRNGGSYAGLGGFGSSEQFANSVYGSFRAPAELGSGGGSDNGPGGNGGGLLQLDAQSLLLDGAILANGGDGAGWGGGGGGGGIKLRIGSLAGVGLIRAHGGNGAGGIGGGGGGGRVAVMYDQADAFDLAAVESIGGWSGFQHGTPGTVYHEGPEAPLGRLIIDARGTNTPVRFTPVLSLAGGTSTALAPQQLTDDSAAFIPGGLIGLHLRPNAASTATFRVIANSTNTITTDPLDGDLTAVAVVGSAYSASLHVTHFALRGGAKVDLVDADRARADRRGQLRATTAEIGEGSWLSHPVGDLVSQFGLEVVVDETLIVDATSRIDVTARGYLGGRSGGNPVNEGRTLGNTPDGGSTRRNGGSHGGSGAFGSAGGTVNVLYGDPNDPNDPGSGGGSDNGAAGNGGGVIRLHVRDLVVDGELLANGGAGAGWGGGGSGGSIKLITRSFSGAGLVQSHGGSGSGIGGGGGGGRIAIFHQEALAFSPASVTALGGSGFGTGTGGSVVIEAAGFVSPANYVAPLRPPTAQPMIERLVGPGEARSGTVQLATPGSGELLGLLWTGRRQAAHVLEMSTDLRRWTELPAQVVEIAPGRYEARFPRPPSGQAYFRLREVQGRTGEMRRP